MRAQSPREEAPVTPGAPVHPNDCNQGLQESEGAFVFCEAVKKERRDAHTQQHTPTLFRMNKPEENNNGGGAAVCTPERLFKEAPGQSRYTKEKQRSTKTRRRIYI